MSSAADEPYQTVANNREEGVALKCLNRKKYQSANYWTTKLFYLRDKNVLFL